MNEDTLKYIKELLAREINLLKDRMVDSIQVRDIDDGKLHDYTIESIIKYKKAYDAYDDFLYYLDGIQNAIPNKISKRNILNRHPGIIEARRQECLK